MRERKTECLTIERFERAYEDEKKKIAVDAKDGKRNTFMKC